MLDVVYLQYVLFLCKGLKIRLLAAMQHFSQRREMKVIYSFTWLL